MQNPAKAKRMDLCIYMMAEFSEKLKTPQSPKKASHDGFRIEMDRSPSSGLILHQ